jgi:hypothetical protein
MAKDILSEGGRAAIEAAWRPVADITMLQRPIFGGVFGMGHYALATMPSVCNGLHAVQYFVIEPRVGAVLSNSEDKREALAAARRLLRASEALTDQVEEACLGVQGTFWPEPTEEPPRPVSRRRRDIYDKCGGACHYCKRSLRLDGEWHIEHMVPKSFGGGVGANLVASCPACNLAKSDKTALEFVSQRAWDKYREENDERT